MMAKMVLEGEKLQLPMVMKMNDLMEKLSEMKDMTIAVEHKSDLIEVCEETKAVIVSINDQTDIIEMNDGIRPSAVMNIRTKNADECELIAFISNTHSDIAVRDG